MPYVVRKRKCKQSDGKSGKYVLLKKSSKDRLKQVSCHTSKQNASGSMRARYASEKNENEEIQDEKARMITISDKQLRKIIREVLAQT